MSHFVLNGHAYDCLDTVVYSITIRDYDGLTEGPVKPCYWLTGAMQGRGSGDPTRWLRELLEALREAM